MNQEAIGQSELFLDFQEQLSKVAPINRSVLLVGERGTGKELAARRLHYLSGRWQAPFITLHCAALSAGLIESELFGHKRGAFTGAAESKTGRFAQADGGTLFLDEIGLIPLETQEKILRVVEYGTFERVGDSRAQKVDVRIVGATNENLKQLVEEQRFKADLLDRLSFEVLFLPPLRLRGGDLFLLAEYFAYKMAFELGIEEEVSFSPQARRQLEEYSWPGNIRELKNVVERAVYKSEQGRVAEFIFDPFSSPWAISEQSAQKEENRAGLPSFPCRLDDVLAEIEIELLKKALAYNRFQQKKAASSLGLSYDQFRSRLRKYNLFSYKPAWLDQKAVSLNKA